ncbi:pirin family protein [Hankyongella ginsenosidimutans]|uniref:pirin family protein n=1 Tax=Hankyongella ginsenosidimutans TaxID=1763828 RepID=UPI00319E69BC
MALPAHAEETDPSFHHHPAATLPSITLDGARRTLIAGSAFGAESPAKIWSQMFYIDVEAEAGATVALPDDHAERAAYIVSGALALDGQSYHAGQMLVLAPGARAILQVTAPSRIALLGGAPFPEPRHIWWNLVSSRLERIEDAKAAWRDQRFPAVPGETEFIPCRRREAGARYPSVSAAAQWPCSPHPPGGRGGCVQQAYVWPCCHRSGSRAGERPALICHGHPGLDDLWGWSGQVASRLV